MYYCIVCFFFQAEDGIRDLVRSRGLGDVYKRQGEYRVKNSGLQALYKQAVELRKQFDSVTIKHVYRCLLYTSDAADERSSVDLGGRRIIKKKKKTSQLIYTFKKKQRITQ